MPPDLNKGARPLAVPSPQRCGGTYSSSLPPISTDENSRDDQPCGGEFLQSVSKGAGNGMVEVKLATTNATALSVPNKYYLTPALRSTFEAVGATAIAYSFKEILGFLKAYLYSKRHLFDTQDILYVNCKEDRLGSVLQVDRFHYNDVRSLIAKHVIQADLTLKEYEKRDEVCGGRVVVNESSSCLVNRQLSAHDNNHERTCNNVSVKSSSNPNPYPYANGKTFSVENTTGSASEEKSFSRSTGQLPTYEAGGPSSLVPSVPGPSSSWESRFPKFHTVKFPVPFIPESDSDSESRYSYQGYETAYCRNTEFEDDSDMECELEEYELASDDESQEQQHSDDNDSAIEDVKVAVLLLHALNEDELEEDFWADDSDIDEQSTDDDPELSSERWDCLTCGIKNPPFVRYCGKCWQLRKNWLPERPRKKRRKPRPRPKKKLRRRLDSIQSTTGITDCRGSDSVAPANCTNTDSVMPGDCKGSDSVMPADSKGSGSFTPDCTESDSVKCEDNEQECSELVRTSSTATTVSLQSEPPLSPQRYNLEQFSSQDSGICLSQDNFMEHSRELEMESSGVNASSSPENENPSVIDVKPSCSQDRQESLLSTTPETGQKNTKQTSCSTTSRKRKSPPTTEDSKAKRKNSIVIETSSDEDESDVNKIPRFFKFLKSDEGSKWLKSATIFDFEQAIDKSTTCSICCVRPKNATITHGRLSHQVTCYQCARRLLDTGARCPVCRRKIHMVSINIRG